jgi:amino-acid N-acetyltransferase
MIGDFYVFEVDRNPVACIALHQYPETGQAELACLYVDTRYENQGIGGRLITFVEEQAREKKAKQLFCLSTQAINYFVTRGGFALGTPDVLPPARREAYDKSNRRSQVLVKGLSTTA